MHHCDTTVLIPVSTFGVFSVCVLDRKVKCTLGMCDSWQKWSQQPHNNPWVIQPRVNIPPQPSLSSTTNIWLDSIALRSLRLLQRFTLSHPFARSAHMDLSWGSKEGGGTNMPFLCFESFWVSQLISTCAKNTVPGRRVVLPCFRVQAFVELHRRHHHGSKGAHHLKGRGRKTRSEKLLMGQFRNVSGSWDSRRRLVRVLISVNPLNYKLFVALHLCIDKHSRIRGRHR